jgi:hypothetical protein
MRFLYMAFELCTCEVPQPAEPSRCLSVRLPRGARASSGWHDRIRIDNTIPRGQGCEIGSTAGFTRKKAQAKY